MRIGFLFMVCAVALAQEAPAPPPPPEAGTQIFQTRVAGPGGPDETKMFIAAEFGFPGKPVKGAPYSAQSVTEFSQTLGDGTRIQQTNTAAVYRDGEGRTRREQPLETAGALVPAGSTPKHLILINDPVAGVNYILNTEDKTVQKMTLPPGAPGTPGETFGYHVAGKAAAGIEGGGMVTMVHRTGPGNRQFKNDSLGTKQMEGLQVQGTRTVITIAAGEIGNDRPIVTTSERWYSPQLQTVVMSKTSDPRMGDTVFKLTNINLSEPDPALFQVPEGYAVQEMPGKVMRFEHRK